MNPDTEQHGGLGSTVFSAIVIALMGYLTFAALQSEHGLFRLFQIEAQEHRLQGELAALQAERAALLEKTRLLSAEAPDLDLLDEQARKVLGLARPNEILIP